ncbi:MAG: hypothetical protein EAZ13_01365 [Sphingobacteriia bacterium]|nr:MAG: hypothetical protein EAZ13_01365 [Sphingobacteriia bacterium]
MVLLSFAELVGRFHPVLVHLPIGILLVAILLKWLSLNPKYQSISIVLPLVLLIGAISAILTCITGYILSVTDDYDAQAISWHQWMGISVAIVSVLLYVKEKSKKLDFIPTKIILLSLSFLMMITGHLGGTITHGADYLTGPIKSIFNSDQSSLIIQKPIVQVQEAKVYTEIITPLLATKCYACHNANKQKGGFRMDEFGLLMQGGKNGATIEPGNAANSELLKRMMLPLDDEHHMPPKEKSQLTESQITLIHWWINEGADSAKRVKEIPQSSRLKPILLALQNTSKSNSKLQTIPEESVAAADEKIIKQLQANNIIVIPVEKNSHYLSINFVVDSVIDDKEIQLLLQLKPQLIWLKLANTNLTDKTLQGITQLSNLTKLDLSNTAITNNGIQYLNTLTQLRYLNLVGTSTTSTALLQLTKLNKLQSLYLYKTGIIAKNIPAIASLFPAAIIDTGGYKVPMYKTDTTEFIKPAINP